MMHWIAQPCNSPAHHAHSCEGWNGDADQAWQKLLKPACICFFFRSVSTYLYHLNQFSTNVQPGLRGWDTCLSWFCVFKRAANKPSCGYLLSAWVFLWWLVVFAAFRKYQAVKWKHETLNQKWSSCHTGLLPYCCHTVDMLQQTSRLSPWTIWVKLVFKPSRTSMATQYFTVKCSNVQDLGSFTACSTTKFTDQLSGSRAMHTAGGDSIQWRECPLCPTEHKRMKKNMSLQIW